MNLFKQLCIIKQDVHHAHILYGKKKKKHLKIYFSKTKKADALMYDQSSKPFSNSQNFVPQGSLSLSLGYIHV